VTYLLLIGSFKTHKNIVVLDPILHTAWLNNHALTLKRNTAKYYFGEKFVVNKGKFKSNSRTF
jgi:hypothetical protein